MTSLYLKCLLAKGRILDKTSLTLPKIRTRHPINWIQENWQLLSIRIRIRSTNLWILLMVEQNCCQQCEVINMTKPRKWGLRLNSPISLKGKYHQDRNLQGRQVDQDMLGQEIITKINNWEACKRNNRLITTAARTSARTTLRITDRDHLQVKTLPKRKRGTMVLLLKRLRRNGLN